MRRLLASYDQTKVPERVSCSPLVKEREHMENHPRSVPPVDPVSLAGLVPSSHMPKVG
jgi:hypothetical protein